MKNATTYILTHILRENDKEFEEKFIRHPAEIIGMKRVEWHELAEDKVDEMIDFIHARDRKILKAIQEWAYGHTFICEMINSHERVISVDELAAYLSEALTEK